MQRLRPLVLVCFVFLLGGILHAQEGADVPMEDIAILLRAELDPPEVSATEGADLVLHVTIPPEYHIYGLARQETVPPTEILLPEGGALVADGDPTGPPPEHHREETGAFVMEYDYHEGEVEFRLPVRARPEAEIGPASVEVTVRYQLCTMSICLPLGAASASVEFRVAEARGEASRPLVPTGANGPAGVGEVGWGGFLLVCLAGGLVTLILPCTYPMIPITLSFFTKQAEKEKGRPTFLAAAYAVGIIVSFTTPGVLVSLFLGATDIQRFAANPWLNLVFGLAFVVFGLSLLGYYEIRLPSFLQSTTAAPGRTRGVVAVLLMGVLFMLTSFTCTAPIVGALFAYASMGHWLRPAFGMFIFSLGLAVPFFFLALAPGALRRLPRSGSWMNSVKVVMGLVEVMAAWKFFSNVDLYWRLGYLPREVLLTIWIGLLLLVAAYLLGWIRFAHDEDSARPGLVRLSLAAGFLVLGAWLAGGIPGRSLGGTLNGFLPPTPYPGTSAGADRDEHAWGDSFENGLERARAEGRPLLVEFSGHL